MIKTSDAIQKDIALRFEDKTAKKFQEGSVIDLYNVAISEVLEDVYTAIENAKNPHIFTNLKGQELDDTGFGVNCPRKDDEDDQSYLYRIMQWKQQSEASNTIAIETGLLNPEYASNIQYVPFTKGCGTATCYIIPNYYDNTTISNALAEAAAIVKKIASPSLFVEYIIPAIRNVKLLIFIGSGGDIELIKNNIEKKIKEYINSIAPGEFLKIGEINKIGVTEPSVDYFSVLSLIIDNEEITDIEILQEIDSKFLFDEIIWSGVS